jgi:hypothetical protein
MKKIFTLLLLAIGSLSINSCTKSGDGSAKTYTVNGLTDIILSQGETFSMTLNIASVGNLQEQVSLDVDGLPDGVVVSFTSKSGTPSFSSRVTFTNTSAVMGTYSGRLIVTGTASGRKYYDFTIEITDEDACGVAGTYTYTQTCNMTPGTEVIDANSANNEVRFSNFGGHGWVARGNVNCANRTIEFPLQSVGNGFSIGGTGNFSTTGTITVSYTIYSTGGNSNCKFNLLRTN